MSAGQTTEIAPLPLILEAVCKDCGTSTRLHHPNGIGGGETPGWTCAVCLTPLSLTTPSWAWTDRALAATEGADRG